MNKHFLHVAAATLCLMGAVALSPAAHAGNDPLSKIQSFTLTDVKAAEAIYAANPSVPTYGAATQCLGYLDTTLSQTGAGSVGSLTVPKGVASAVADIDVALNGTTTGLSPAVVTFNQSCGAYIEDLKAEGAAIAAKVGVTLPFGIKF